MIHSLQLLLGLSLEIGLVVGVGLSCLGLRRGVRPGQRYRLLVATLGMALLVPLIPSVPSLPHLWDLRWPGTPEAHSVLSGLNSTSDLLVDSGQQGAEILPASLTEWLPGVVCGLLLAILAVGSLLFFARLGLGLHRLGGLARGAKPAALSADVWLGAKLADGRKGGQAVVLRSDEVSSPLTFGVLNPVVLLPTSFWRLPTKEQSAALCHELLHVSRRDWLVAFLGEGVRCALWFHPLIWPLLRGIEESREEAVDGEVVALTGDPEPYLRVILRFALAAHPRPVCSTGMAGLGLTNRRIQLLRQEPTMRTKSRVSSVFVVCTIVASAIAAASAFPAGPQEVSAKIQQEGASVSETSSEPVFVTGDVTPPQRLETPRPEYTELARSARIQGVVIVQVIVDRAGRTNSAKILKGLPMGLSEQALEAVRQWTFEPATLDGEPVAVHFNLTVNFQLDQKAESIARSVLAPIKSFGEPPKYTAAAKQAGLVGLVVLSVTVDKEGRVQSVGIKKSLGLGLAEAAVAAVYDWTFEPALENGRAVPATFIQSLTFALD